MDFAFLRSFDFTFSFLDYFIQLLECCLFTVIRCVFIFFICLLFFFADLFAVCLYYILLRCNLNRLFCFSVLFSPDLYIVGNRRARYNTKIFWNKKIYLLYFIFIVDLYLYYKNETI